MKEKIIGIKDQFIKLIIEQKILSVIFALIIIMLAGTIYISANQVKEIKTPKNSLRTIKPTIFKSSDIPGKTIPSITSPTGQNPTNSAFSPQSLPTHSIINKSPAPRPTQVTKPTNKPQGPSSAVQPTSASSNSGSSGQSQPTASPNPTSIPAPTVAPTSAASSLPQIIFIGPDGQQQAYVPPETPPVEITWARYTNQLEHYAIDYPSNWQIVTTQYRGHAAIFIYAPGADPSDPDVQYISYGWSTYFYPPTASYVGSFMLDDVSGTIYTNGSLGSSFIAGVFQYSNGFLVLNNNVSSEEFAYVFNHMLLSLDFNTP